jgi:hypothetical protein
MLQTLLYLIKQKSDAENAGNALWSRAMQQSKLPDMLIPSSQMIPALNSMFDVATTIEVTLYARVPELIGVHIIYSWQWLPALLPDLSPAQLSGGKIGS